MHLTITRTSRSDRAGVRLVRGPGAAFAVAAAVLALGLAVPTGAAADESAPVSGDLAVVGSDDVLPQLPTAPQAPVVDPESNDASSEDGGDAAASVAVALVEQPDGSLKVETHETGSPAAAEAVAGALGKAPNVVASGVDHQVSALAAPDDAFFSCQWALQSAPAKCDPDGDTVDNLTGKTSNYTAPFALKGETVWAKSTGTDVVVAVVDSGVQSTHEDLSGQVLNGTDYIQSGTKGHVDEAGHGTHVAGIIAAKLNNLVDGVAVGVVGLAPNAKILPVRVLDANGNGSDSTVAKGVLYAVDHGADVINLSLGGDTPSSVQQSAINYAIAKGVLVVVAAGNAADYGNPVFYPAAFPGVLAVAASDLAGHHASFSERKPYVGVAAPGVDIASTYIDCQDDDGVQYVDNCYVFESGTSMATPYVSAMAALLLERNPNLSPAALSAYITGTATDDGAPGRDISYGFGHINPDKALTQVIAGTVRPSLTGLLTTGKVPSGTKITLTATSSSSGYRLPHRRITFEKYSTTWGHWVKLADAYTDGNGVARYRVSISQHARFRAVAYAIPGLGTDSSPTDAVRATAKVSVSGSSPSNDKVTVKVTVAPKTKVVAKLQRRSGSTWVAVSTQSTSSTGTVTFSNKKVPDGKQFFRVVVSSSALADPGTSRTFSITVP